VSSRMRARCTPWVRARLVRAGVLHAVALAAALGGVASAQEPGDHGLIAFQSASAGLLQIYVVNPDGLGRRQLTRGPASDAAPEIFPDGKRDLPRGLGASRVGSMDAYYDLPTQDLAPEFLDVISGWLV
jgi:hypothetical protein